jgi:hypothetical protein
MQIFPRGRLSTFLGVSTFLGERGVGIFFWGGDVDTFWATEKLTILGGWPGKKVKFPLMVFGCKNSFYIDSIHGKSLKTQSTPINGNLNIFFLWGRC